MSLFWYYYAASLITLVAGVAAMAGLASFWRKRAANPDSSRTRFLGSQVGDKSVINYSYTDMPWRLMAWDVYYFFKFIWALPHILVPMRPTDSGHLAELSFTRGNIFCIAVHIVLCVLQLGFIAAIPALILLPIWTAVVALGLFFLVNHGLCTLINGEDVEYHSDPQYAPALPEHAHEQWIFINGVAVGAHWMQSNLDRLALTFKRPVLGIHNKTYGIIFDVVECLVQRNLGYATTDVRVCYRIIKEKLYNPRYSKVVFVLHSQGAIEGSLILDWLLQELPQDLLSKLEVYTFGNAANHFNNPHRHVRSQDVALRNPIAASTDSTNLASGHSEAAPILQAPLRAQSNGDSNSNDNSNQMPPTPTASPPPNPTTPNSTQPSAFSMVPALTYETSSFSPSSVSDRAIGHIEHYAHTTDFVALWGILHFSTTIPERQTLPRFIGRVFARTSPRGGHQFCQHYLDGMFPLAREDGANGKTKFVGCQEEGNDFMESEIVIGADGDEMASVREAMEVSWLGRTAAEAAAQAAVEIHGGSPVEQRGRFRNRIGGVRGERRETKVKVKELSRLWQYRNGRSPRDASGFARTATL
ncbi:hypothetical protein B0T25DRAFT_286021 [Lasiosphaeria hispida]|uniref:DUF676 domain-containing protein n=1 Tax=Lasiosphaeria hispida TaxID=260671 RepID=A0AAJ0MBC3_9PEZI|nr:hypothetical protein B0T25DRAFT_286021 [Lasiosphaeria hispida]